MTYYDSPHIHVEANYPYNYFVHKKIYKDKNNEYYSDISGNFYLGVLQSSNKNQSIRLGYFLPLSEDNNLVFFAIIH